MWVLNTADVAFPFLTFSTIASHPTLSGLVKWVLVNQIIRKEKVPKECSALAAREEYCGINQTRTGKVAVFCGEKKGKIMGKNKRQRKGKRESQLTCFSQKYLFYIKTTKEKRRNKQKVKKYNERLNGGSRGRKWDPNLFPRVKYIPLTTWLGFCFCVLPPSAS